MQASIINTSFVVLSIMTSIGVYMHDLRIDKLSVDALPIQITSTTPERKVLPHDQSDHHVHVDRFSVAHHGLHASHEPRIRDDRRQYALQHASRKSHFLGNYHIPI